MNIFTRVKGYDDATLIDFCLDLLSMYPDKKKKYGWVYEFYDNFDVYGHFRPFDRTMLEQAAMQLEAYHDRISYSDEKYQRLTQQQYESLCNFNKRYRPERAVS